ncbi:MAG: zinc ribbon domain-containing protein [Defluviitaleaceae bacterium]|nr:zinc ribbon domain-containing protein [Defluviitaleaceae bacterium]
MEIIKKLNGAIETNKLNAKISTEQDAINAIITKIGTYYYEKYVETGTADEGTAEFYAAIDGHKRAIAEVKAEIERINNANTADGLVCSACGKASAADRKFCAECGGKLEAAKPADAPGGLVCSACGKPSAADRKFCAHCGNKLEIANLEKRVCGCGAEVAGGIKFCGNCGKPTA